MHTLPHPHKSPTASPAVPLDPAVVAIGRSGAANVDHLLVELSHVDPDDDPLEHARIWQEIHEADHQSAAQR